MVVPETVLMTFEISLRAKGLVGISYFGQCYPRCSILLVSLSPCDDFCDLPPLELSFSRVHTSIAERGPNLTRCRLVSVISVLVVLTTVCSLIDTLQLGLYCISIARDQNYLSLLLVNTVDAMHIA